MNARFNEFINGSVVTLTLKPGQSLTWGKSWRHDEGGSYESHQWRFDGETLFDEAASGGTDCDGRIDQYEEYACPVALAKANWNEHAGALYPAWETVDAWQRDQFAESMNY
jgi:hypothetical protein